MKTLVIHPEDSTTWFLNRVYKNIENLTLVTVMSVKTKLNR